MSPRGFKVALRVARRDALRAKGRTALVLCMIGLPVTAIVALAVLYFTMDWNSAERLPHELGQADARLDGATGHAPISQDVLGESWRSTGDASDAKPWTPEEVRAAVRSHFGPSARILSTGESYQSMKTDRGYTTANVRELDLRDPLTRGTLEITEGRAPASPDEVAVSAAVRDRGHPIGGTIQLTRDDKVKKVVGYVRSPLDGPDHKLVQALPGSGLIDPADGGTARWLLDAGRAVGWSDVESLNKLGLAVTSAEIVRDPPSGIGDPNAGSSGAETATIAIGAMAVAMIVLEVVLLAGPAFAVGLRRQRRQLALVAANGGEARHLRAIVLAGGIVLGITAAAIGAILGIAIALAAAPILGRYGGTPEGPLEVKWQLVTATMALGALSGLLAAYVPARQAARTNVVAALAGRREETRTPRGWPAVGGVVIAAGIGVSVLGVRQWREFGAALGAVAIVVGCVLVGPWVVAVAGRTARWLPLPMRLAVRDGSRNRGRSAPAVAAIMAAVAGITTLAIGGASDFAQGRVEYLPRLPMGSATLYSPPQDAGSAERALAQELPGVRVQRVDQLLGQDCSGQDDCEERDGLELAQVADGSFSMGGSPFLVGGPAEARFVLGRDDPAVTAALQAGKVVVFDLPFVKDGAVTARVVRDGEPKADGEVTQQVLRTVKLPALGLRESSPLVSALFPPAAVKKIGLAPSYAFHAIDRADHRVTPAEQSRIEERLAGVMPEGATAEFYVERGFTESFAVPMLLLALAGGVMVLGGSLIATGLSAADARPDLATLAAVGARPRTRRLLMMGQAAFVAVLGCWLGIAAGLVPGIAVAHPLTSTDESYYAGLTFGASDAPAHGAIIDIPWQLLGAIGIAVPLVAMLAAGLFTRSRLPTVRRLT